MNAAPDRASSDLARQLRAALEPGADDGWAYYSGQRARIEPACWAALALSSGNTPDTASVSSALAFLGGRQREDGLLVEPDSGIPNFGWNGLALIAAGAAPAAISPAWTGRVTAALLRSKGIRITNNQATDKQNDQLQAWSWIDGTFSWIEPTAYCVLALKKTGARDAVTASRLSEAEAVILDRVCESGGWNYGNAQVFAQDLRPYVPTSALALLAMQDKRNVPAVAKSLDWLTTNALSERSAMALSIAAICLTVYGRPTAELLTALAADYQRTAFLENIHLTAMALYALSLPSHGARAFTL